MTGRELLVRILITLFGPQMVVWIAYLPIRILWGQWSEGIAEFFTIMSLVVWLASALAVAAACSDEGWEWMHDYKMYKKRIEDERRRMMEQIDNIEPTPTRAKTRR